MGRRVRFTEAELRQAVAESLTWAGTLRRLGYCPTGGNPATIKKYVALWDIDTSHFDPDAVRLASLRTATPTPIEKILVRRSTYSRSHLKERLYKEGLKSPICEMCGQGEIWHGRKISLTIDHINGERDDNRLDNLRIVCPNCAATLPTHCGRSLKQQHLPRTCGVCDGEFTPKNRRQKYCSRECGQRRRRRGVPAPESRKVERPPYEQLLRELEETSFLAVGRKYGVSDNAVRKWLRFYERQHEREERQGRPGPGGADGPPDSEAA